MSTLNRDAAAAMLRHRCHGATDITGNGLLGHAYEMAQASGAALRFWSATVPVLPEALELTRQGTPPPYRTHDLDHDRKTPPALDPSSPNLSKTRLLDPQTSGGLLIAVDGHGSRKPAGGSYR